jgi:hypothetical protein
MGSKRSFDTRPKLAAPPPRATRLTVTPADLDQAMGKSKTGFAGVGKSTYATIRQTLAEYQRAQKNQKPGNEAKLVTLLERLDILCTDWLNTHRGQLSPQDTSRRKLFMRLSGDLAEERAALSQKQAQDVYLESLTTGTQLQDNDSAAVNGPQPAAAPDSPHRFKAASHKARMAGADSATDYRYELINQKRAHKILGGEGEIGTGIEERMKLVREKGLTPAEHAAITAYTLSQGDFAYMNAATANSKEWMDAVKAGREGKALKLDQIDDKTLREEGSLHTAVARAGLLKLDPFEKATYRGETKTEEEFRDKVGVGKVVRFPNLHSTSKKQGVPFNFVSSGLSAKRDVAVFWAFDNRGGNARDVEKLSAIGGEGEVLFLPGSSFAIFTVVEVGAPGGASSAGPHADFYNLILARLQSGGFTAAKKVYLVHAVALPTKKAPLPPLPALPAS